MEARRGRQPPFDIGRTQSRAERDAHHVTETEGAIGAGNLEPAVGEANIVGRAFKRVRSQAPSLLEDTIRRASERRTAEHRDP